MLNSRNYDELLESSSFSAKERLTSLLSESIIPFSQIGEFPECNGLYFVMLGEEVLYIGKADKQTIKGRCEQYLNKSTGATLRKKIECVRSCNKDEAILYIKDYLSAKFIILNDIEQIPVIEEVAIWSFQPKLNVIKPSSFTFERLIIQ